MRRVGVVGSTIAVYWPRKTIRYIEEFGLLMQKDLSLDEARQQWNTVPVAEAHVECESLVDPPFPVSHRYEEGFK